MPRAEGIATEDPSLFDEGELYRIALVYLELGETDKGIDILEFVLQT